MKLNIENEIDHKGKQMDEIDGTIEPYDMTCIFLKMYIFM